MKKLRFILLAALAVSLLGSCEKQNDFKDKGVNPQSSVVKSSVDNTVMWPEEDGCNLHTFDLIGGQHTHMGTVSVITYAGSVYVKYEANDGCLIKETHLFLGDTDELDLLIGPAGNPKIGHFPQKWEGSEGRPVVIHEVDLANLSDCFDIAAHAVVWCPDGEETAWAKGANQVFAIKSYLDIDGGNAYVITGKPGVYCTNFRYYSVEAALALNAPIDLVNYIGGSKRHGQVEVDLIGDEIVFTIDSDIGDVHNSYLFVGTVEDLNAHGICNYSTFINSKDVSDSKHIYKFPASILSSPKEFEGSRWGWTVKYCAGGC